MPPASARATTRGSLAARQVAAVAIGNALQFYDFLTYGFFAVQIGRTFFPSHDAASSLLASLATFGAGYLTRPLGAVVIGSMGDRLGRKPAMVLSFALMGLGILGLALTPSYAQIGVAAPVAAIAFRLLQGFALGGEVGPSTAYLIEAAPSNRRGVYVSLQYATQDAAILTAGLVGAALSAALSPTALDQWGWRVALGLGAGLLPLGLWLRGGIPETLGVADPGAAPATSKRSFVRLAAICLAMQSAATICFGVMNYMTVFAEHTLGLPARIAIWATVAIGLGGLLCDVLGGALSDRFGRKPVMMAPWGLLLALIFPAYFVIIRGHGEAALLVGTFLLTLPLSIATASVLTSVAESMPPTSRSASIGILYTLSATVFGGSTQFVLAWLTRETASPWVGAACMAAAVVLGLGAMALMPETAPRKAVVIGGATDRPLPSRPPET